MRTRSQEYAVNVWRVAEISRTANDFNTSHYGGMAHQLPVLIQSCGLMQALAFVRSRGQKWHNELLDDLAEVIGQSNGEAFYRHTLGVELSEYLRLSEISIEALLWFKRFAQSELKVEDGGDAGFDAAEIGVTNTEGRN